MLAPFCLSLRDRTQTHCNSRSSQDQERLRHQCHIHLLETLLRCLLSFLAVRGTMSRFGFTTFFPLFKISLLPFPGVSLIDLTMLNYCEFFRCLKLFLLSPQGGQSLMLKFFFIAESDSGGYFTHRKTYDSLIFHICINAKYKNNAGVLIDKKKRKLSNIFTSMQV